MPEVHSFSYGFGGFPFPRREGDLVINARVLPNPFKPDSTGLDANIHAIVMRTPRAQELVDHAIDYLTRWPNERVLVGCSYGRHRSVVLAEEIAYRVGVKAEHHSPKFKEAVNGH